MLISKLPQSGTTIFTVMSALAKASQAINLAQGFPDFPISDQLISEVQQAMLQGMNQYAPMTGLPELRQALSEKIQTCYACSVDAENEITITPGATYAIYSAFATLLQAGDEVIVLEPAYDSYIPNILLHGGIPVCVPLQAPTFQVNWQRVYDAVSDKTKAIIINTPHNPCGSVWSHDDFLQLEQLLDKHPMYVVSDEVYEHITFDAHQHHSVLKYPAIYQKAFVVFSFGKVFHTTGWKLGYCVAPADLSNEFRKIHQYLAFSCNTPMQFALSRFLAQPQEYLNLPSFFEAKRNLFLKLIADLPFTLHAPSQGTYFQTLGYEQISMENDMDFATRLTKAYGVATIPLSAFYQNKEDNRLIRFCFAKQDSTLQAAAHRLQALKSI